MIELGYIYIALSPFYRVNKNGEYLYFMDNKEYNDFKNSIIKEKYSLLSKDIKFNKLLNNSERFKMEFDRIRYKYAIEPDILSVIVHNDTKKDIIKELKEDYGLSYDKRIDSITGLYDNNWHDFNLDELMDESEELKDIYGIQYISILDKETKEEIECDIYDGLNLLNSAYKYIRTRFKGLGEADAEELEPTTINPLTRRMIKVNPSLDKEVEDELMKVLFGSNADLRKEYIISNLFN